MELEEMIRRKARYEKMQRVGNDEVEDWGFDERHLSFLMNF